MVLRGGLAAASVAAAALPGSQATGDPRIEHMVVLYME